MIREIPFSKNTTTLIESILKAVDKGKIKAKRVDDNTAAEVEIQVHLAPGISSDKTIDALYAFSDCEINISPNCCVIEDNKPCFLTVSEVLRHNVDSTMGLLRLELQIRKDELLEQLFFSSLEKIFIEERIYKDKKFENAENMDAAVEHIDNRLTPFKPNFIRELRRDDIMRLMEIKMQRILKFSKDKADELLARIKEEIDGIDHDLAHMTDVTIKWFKFLIEKYGKDHPRLTEIKSFETIEATKVVEANEKLYINRREGFIGTGLKKDEFVCNCSDIDDILVFYRDGKYKLVRVADKIFVGKNVMHLQVYKRNDRRTTYNMVYRDGKEGNYFIKRFNITSITRDREYDLTQGTAGSKVVYFTDNPNGEAETIRVILEPESPISRKKCVVDFDFSKVIIKARTSRGNIICKRPIKKIGLLEAGHSTLGGRKVWFDPDVNRINYDDHGQLLGEFNENDSILVVLDNCEFYLSDFDANNHYEDNLKIIEKWDQSKVWSAVVLDADNDNFAYVKRFVMEGSKRKQSFLGDNPKNKLLFLSDQPYPRIKVVFGGSDKERAPMEIDVEEFVAIKGFKAKGKRITTWHVDHVEELEPTRQPEPETEPDDDTNAADGNASGAASTASSSPRVKSTPNPQQTSLFQDEP